jgi:hypothetical protein
MPNPSTQRCRHRHCRHAVEWHAGPPSPHPGRLHVVRLCRRRFRLVGGAGGEGLATTPALPSLTLQRQHRLLSMIGLSGGNGLWAVAKARSAGMPNPSTWRCWHRHCHQAAERHAGPLLPHPDYLCIVRLWLPPFLLSGWGRQGQACNRPRTACTNFTKATQAFVNGWVVSWQ